MKRIFALAISGLFFLFCMSACGGGGSSSDVPATDGKTTRSSDLSRFSSDSELETYLKEGLRAGSSDENMMLRYDTMAAAAPETAANDAKDSGAGVVFSGTNLQEAGVDEADIIKSDGKYLYIAAGRQEPVYWLMGEKTVEVSAEESESDGSDSANVDAAPDSPEKPLIAPAPAIIDTVLPETEKKDPVIRVLSLSENPAQSTEIASISLKDFENSVNGLYLVKDRGNAKPDLLITTGGNANDVWGCWYSPWYWNSGITEIGIFDVSAPENPSLLYYVKLDGQLISTRRIGDKLYAVTRYTPNLPEYVPYPATREQEEQNEKVLENAKLGDMLPKMEVNGISTALVASDQCWLPPVNEDRNEEPNLITVTAIDLANPENRVSASIAGPTETIYVSTQSMYLATTRYYYQPMVGILEDADSVSESQTAPPETTDIHKFTLTSAGPVYKGSGSVTGHLGWKEDQKPFRMGEYNSVLRVATSLGNTWEGSATTRLTLLKEGTDSTLTETAHVDNIGETGESLYAVRFVGTRAYLVTFRVTDPLYIFDLSNPASPRKAGELHISGYSDYLHPIGENLLLGIGKDAVPDDASSDFEGRGAWYQGVKLSLFDVSNPSAPYEKKSIVIGKRGTESDALMDHHALAYLPSENGNPARLALPVQLHDTPYTYYTEDSGYDPSHPSTWYDWTHTGLYLFDISETDIVSTGKMIVEDRSGYEYAPWSSTTDRAVIAGDSVHYVHNAQVWSALWSDAENMSGPE